MTPPVPAVRDARREDFPAVATVLTEAFLHGDLAPWLIPPLDDRTRIYPEYFAMLTEHALEHAHVEITDDRYGVAVWYHHDGRNPPPIRDYDTRLATVTHPYAARFAALDDAMQRRHPRDPHDYLAFLAVHPDRHGNGYGTRLLRHHHVRLDAAGLSSYLEATGHRNQRLYARHGYLPREPYRIARKGPRLHPMSRSATARVPGRSRLEAQPI